MIFRLENYKNGNVTIKDVHGHGVNIHFLSFLILMRLFNLFFLSPFKFFADLFKMQTCEIIYADYAAASDSISRSAHRRERLSEVAGLTPAQSLPLFSADHRRFYVSAFMHEHIHSWKQH